MQRALACCGREPSATELENRLNEELSELRELTGAEVCELFLREPGDGDMLLAIHYGPSDEAFLQMTRFHSGEGFPGLVAEYGEPVFSYNLPDDNRFIRSKVKEEGFLFYLCVPISTSLGVTGGLGIASRSPIDVGAVYPHVFQTAERLIILIEFHRMRCRLELGDLVLNSQRDGKGNFDGIVSAVLRNLLRLSGADGGIVLLQDPTVGMMRRAERCGGFENMCQIASGKEYLARCKIAGGGQCMAFIRRKDSPSSMCKPLLREYEEIACLPLRNADSLYGITILGYVSEKREAIESITFLPSVARQAVQLVRNAYAVLEVERQAAARERERVRADLGGFILQSLETVVTKAEATTAMAALSPAAVHPAMVSLNTVLRDSLTTIKNRVIGPSNGETTVPEPIRESPPARRDAARHHRVRRNPVAGEQTAGFLDFRCLGRFTILSDGRPIPLTNFSRQRALTMLKVLLTNYGRAMSKDALIDILWPEAEATKGGILLKVAAHYLRRGLEPEVRNGRDSRYIETVADGYMFNPESPHRLDVTEFLNQCRFGERLVEQGDWKAGLALWQGAADLYAGDYLEEEIYSDWSMRQREYLRERFLALTQSIADLMLLKGNGEGAVAYYRRALEVDALQESLHRSLMRALWQLGRRDEALRQYRLCQELMARELGTRTLPETDALYRQIASNTPCPSGLANK